MFDVGFSELIVIAVVALIVIGPERLPRVARTAGHLLGRLQRYVNDVKSDINREMQLDELKKLQGQLQESARDLEQSMHSVSADVHAAGQELNQSLQGQPVNGAAAPSPTSTEPPAALPAAPQTPAGESSPIPTKPS